MTSVDHDTVRVVERRLARNLRLAYRLLPVQQLTILERTPGMTLLDVAEAAVIGEVGRQTGAAVVVGLDAREIGAAVLEAIGARPVDAKRRPVSPG